ncbi:hypothetical protein [[Mycoplasma] mobile]|uniref:hypothetical protein n=1 Tax=[Mycoplasma] mobile TaxID=2118 RepID=UPI00030139B1|nr:hypothetical protein [[Mycoplasma] mobile]
MGHLKIIASSEKSTVVAEYIPEEKKQTSYQSEMELEKEFIKDLMNQGYEYNIKS